VHLAAAFLVVLFLAEPAISQRGERGRGRRPDVASDLPTAVDEAIEHGVEHLLSRQLRDGSWGDYATEYGIGQTALSLFTLLRSGVPPTHPAVRRGFARVEDASPTRTYTLACLLLAHEAWNDPERGERMKNLLEILLDGQEGSFGYPGTPAGAPGPARSETWTDLSNTQFAALGLRAARQAGLRVPPKAWEELLEATLAYQEEPWTVADPRKDERSSTGVVEVAGFRYHAAPTGPPPGRGGDFPGGPPGFAGAEPTGSMTAAGIAVLAICREGLGRKLPGRSRLGAIRAEARGLAWLAHHFSADRNPGSGAWLEYYLYGLERVGALLEIERIGDHDWYREGARRLVRDQLRTGAWPGRQEESATCFALLFLQRATAPVTGEKRRRGTVHVSGGDVHLRATGRNPLTVWIDGFDEEVRREYGVDGAGPRVAQVVHLVDGEAVATLEGDAERGWDGEKYPWQHAFTRTGDHEIGARVRILDVDESRGPTPVPVILEADGFVVRVEDVLSDWMLPCARRAAANLLLGKDVAVEASSRTGSSPPHAAADGLQSTAWVANSSDLQPTISLRWESAIRADVITLGGADARPEDRGRHDTIVRAEVIIDGGERISVLFDRDVLRPAVLRLKRPRAIRRLDVRIVERIPGSGRTSSVGLAEVGLHRER